ncbi:hypothetical protein [Streptomyces atriruber]|uniref:hypothetical protein n=1 Tax=Streptomyces atriruber TaxID=545121 RepID=UPI0006E3E4D0|nr:hypothetical protein [Streptomyces atriruber]
MSAREAMIRTGVPAAALDAYAHELAEKIRADQDHREAEERARFNHLDHETELQGDAVRRTADLIDPTTEEGDEE